MTSGYFVGRIPPEQFEYRELSKNNWMSPNEAARLCETDLECAGFTFRGSKDVLHLATSIYFFHHFPADLLDQPSEYSASWVSYRAKRPFVVFKGSYREWLMVVVVVWSLGPDIDRVSQAQNQGPTL